MSKQAGESDAAVKQTLMAMASRSGVPLDEWSDENGSTSRLEVVRMGDNDEILALVGVDVFRTEDDIACEVRYEFASATVVAAICSDDAGTYPLQSCDEDSLTAIINEDLEAYLGSAEDLY